MHVEIGYRKICHLANCIQLVTMHLSSNLRTGLYANNYNSIVALQTLLSKSSCALIM